MARIKQEDIDSYHYNLIETLYEEGYGILDIALQVKINDRAVKNYLIEKGLYNEKKKPNIKAIEEFIVERFNAGKTPEEIAFENNISPHGVYGALKRLKLWNGKYKYAGKEFKTTTELDRYRRKLGKIINNEYKQGTSKCELAAKYSITTRAAEVFIGRAGTENWINVMFNSSSAGFFLTTRNNGTY